MKEACQRAVLKWPDGMKEFAQEGQVFYILCPA